MWFAEGWLGQGCWYLLVVICVVGKFLYLRGVLLFCFLHYNGGFWYTSGVYEDRSSGVCCCCCFVSVFGVRMMSFLFFFLFFFLFYLPAKEKRNLCTAESAIYMCSARRGEAGHRAGKHKPRQRGRECRGWDGLGRLNPAMGNDGMHRGKKQRAYIYIVKDTFVGSLRLFGFLRLVQEHCRLTPDFTFICF